MTKDHQPSEIDAGELEKALREVILSSIHQGKSVTAEGLGTFRKSHIKSREKVEADGRIFLMPPADRIEFEPALGNLSASLSGSLSGSEKLSANELVRNVSHRLSASEEHVDRALTALAERIQEEVARDGRSDMEGFGVFLRGDENTDESATQTLRFIPFPSTAIQVNAWNTGMEAVDPTSGALQDVTVSDLMEVWDDAREKRWSDGVKREDLSGEIDGGDGDVGTGGDVGAVGVSGDIVADGVGAGDGTADGAGDGTGLDGGAIDESRLGGVPGSEAGGELDGENSGSGSGEVVDRGSSDRSDGVDNGEDMTGSKVTQRDGSGSEVTGRDGTEKGMTGRKGMTGKKEITGTDHLSDTSKRNVGSGIWMVLRVAAALAGLGLIGWYLIGHISERVEEGWVVERSVMELAGQPAKGAHKEGDSHEEGSYEEGLLDEDEDGSGTMNEAGEAQLVDAGEGVDASTRKEMEEMSAEAGAGDVSTEVDAEKSSAEKSSAESLYGLMGGVADVEAGGYCIVLFSLTNEARADRMIATLGDEGFKTAKMIRSTGDGSLYRVAVGQFPSVEDAQEAAELLPEPYRSNHFVTRLE